VVEIGLRDFRGCRAACFFGEMQMNGVLPALLREAGAGEDSPP
jgi:hypothetical protein